MLWWLYKPRTPCTVHQQKVDGHAREQPCTVHQQKSSLVY